MIGEERRRRRTMKLASPSPLRSSAFLLCLRSPMYSMHENKEESGAMCLPGKYTRTTHQITLALLWNYGVTHPKAQVKTIAYMQCGGYFRPKVRIAGWAEGYSGEVTAGGLSRLLSSCATAVRRAPWETERGDAKRESHRRVAETGVCRFGPRGPLGSGCGWAREPYWCLLSTTWLRWLLGTQIGPPSSLSHLK